MSSKEKQVLQERIPGENNAKYIPSYGLLSITHAYNEGKISIDDWLKQSREWAEAIIKQHDKKKLA
jgi:hypothetical protein